MVKDLSFKAVFCSLLFLSLTFYCVNGQMTLKSFKDSTGKYGYKDQSGQIVIPAKYQSASSFVKDLAAVKLNDKWGFINSTGKEVISIKYQEENSFIDGLARVKLNDKWGVIDQSGKEVIPIKYQEVNTIFVDGLLRVKANDKWGMVDKSGNEIIPIKYQNIYDFYDGLAAVRLNDKYGFIDKNDKVVVATRFQSVIISFQEGLCGAQWNDKWGFIDKAGNEVVSNKYQEVKFFRDGWAKVKLNDKWGAVDKTGNEIIPPRYDDVFSYIFSTGLGKVKLDKKWGAVDKAGKEVIAIKYEDLYPTFNDGLSTVKLNGKWGYIDTAGKEVVPFKYTDTRNFTAGYAQVKLNGLVGYIDKTGKEVIPVKYQAAHGFSEDLAAVQINDKWGYVDKTGKEVIPPQYEFARDFFNGKAQVKKDGKEFYINKPTSQIITVTKNTDGPATPSAKALEPPMTMHGQVDASLVGAWKWQPRQGETGAATIYNFKNDGTYEFYIGSSIHPDLRWYKDLILYWRVNGNTLETYSTGWKEVAKTLIEKRNDATTNKPAIVMQAKDASYAYISMDNKPLFTGIQTVNLNTMLNNPPKDGHDPAILGLWKYQYPGTTNTAYIKLNADGSYESYNNSVTSANRTDKGKCKWTVEDGMFVLSCEGSQITRNTIKKKNDPATGKPTLVLADYYPYFSMDSKQSW